MQLSVSLLGPFEVRLEGKPATFATDRARALLAFLAVEANRPHRREVLAGLVWPDRPEPIARQNLSQSLVRVRRAIDDYRADPPFLHITAKAIQFNTASADLDVASFEEALRSAASHRHSGPDQCRECVRHLKQATRLYRGELLEGLSLGDSLPFEEWALIEREHLHRQAMAAFRTLAAHFEARHAYGQAQHYAERQLALEPWREGAHRQLMRVFALGGERSAALSQFETCRRALAEELSVEPTAETILLYERIREQKVTFQGPSWRRASLEPPG